VLQSLSATRGFDSMITFINLLNGLISITMNDIISDIGILRSLAFQLTSSTSHKLIEVFSRRSISQYIRDISSSGLHSHISIDIPEYMSHSVKFSDESISTSSNSSIDLTLRSSLSFCI